MCFSYFVVVNLKKIKFCLVFLLVCLPVCLWSWLGGEELGGVGGGETRIRIHYIKLFSKYVRTPLRKPCTVDLLNTFS